MSLNPRYYQYLDTIRKVYVKQLEMYRKRNHSVVYHIENIQQQYVCPIVRGKENAKIEFNFKINVTFLN